MVGGQHHRAALFVKGVHVILVIELDDDALLLPGIEDLLPVLLAVADNEESDLLAVQGFRRLQVLSDALLLHDAANVQEHRIVALGIGKRLPGL